MRTRLVVLLLGGLLLPPSVSLSAASASGPDYSNCPHYQQTFPHGVGTRTAHDHTSGTPVTTFRKDDAEYARAMKQHPDLDRDQDGIACEKR